MCELNSLPLPSHRHSSSPCIGKRLGTLTHGRSIKHTCHPSINQLVSLLQKRLKPRAPVIALVRHHGIRCFEATKSGTYSDIICTHIYNVNPPMGIPTMLSALLQLRRMWEASLGAVMATSMWTSQSTYEPGISTYNCLDSAVASHLCKYLQSCITPMVKPHQVISKRLEMKCIYISHHIISFPLINNNWSCDKQVCMSCSTRGRPQLQQHTDT